MNLLLGVNAGSNDEPYLIEARYIAEGLDKPTTALVGKGVCFDSQFLNTYWPLTKSAISCINDVCD